MSNATRSAAIPPRTIQPPQSISAEAQAALSRLVDEDGSPINARYGMPSPEDVSGWMAMKAAADAHYAAAIKGMAGSLQSTAETITIDGATIHVATPHGAFDAGGALIDLHGGGLVFGGGEACRVSALCQAQQHAVRCYGVDYRMPPEHPYPAALDDCLATYRHVLNAHAPEKVIILGRSAGGNLASAMLLRARDQGLPMPGRLVLLSPQVDLTESGDSFQTNQMVDLVLPRPLRSNNLLYAGGANLSDPYLSPLFGDLRGFPPTFLQTGTRDLFLSNTVRMHRALRKAGVETELHVFEAMPHGGFMGGTPEDQELESEIRQFVGRGR
ncbi:MULTISPECIES: alpha/beta hydrolase [Rhizobium]|uniref:Acetyl esterase/lipase n=1 Tax=Rhizobium tropici TaxID=398 RepID=A0A6P1C287_RHITR|nr:MULTISPECIES: alpha/beta hydrolase [Rhizobium]AGB73156.1 alpha/beta hydrolase fold-3 catalytic domain-containing protein [Rhizobium tropici CIAT 899]MBB4243662.1 acetyl esterase/lipase [Rhizobium tropici]MBB5595889.1 acetyl esterase/lipase [Rhizobium tropici]MBB6493881.1 acetyl esterase/lipase [Rhizobium tropici]NEV11320.1 alpha/beta hydrolase [Rhizobium tropici]